GAAGRAPRDRGRAGAHHPRPGGGGGPRRPGRGHVRGTDRGDRDRRRGLLLPAHALHARAAGQPAPHGRRTPRPPRPGPPPPGSPPSMTREPSGCAFAPRCPLAQPVCHDTDPPLVETGRTRAAACHFTDRLGDVRAEELFPPPPPVPAAPAGTVPAEAEGTPLLVADGLVKHFPVRSKGLLRRRSGEVHAVCDVSLELRARQTLALVGE